ncbi:hypothetical protein [Frondihabitans sp. PAMC 28766]|uniref:hypothetical protein n=1 Tax=Frondihabitans sp. PAMC 28766 TaxID=1795630 RepID=UPI001952591F|nr:hypothetical protein [Frondihabitans sp. PAMC 28766]
MVTDASRLRPAASEVDRLLSDNSLARDLTGWQPDVSLEDGLRATWQWAAERPAGSGAYAV